MWCYFCKNYIWSVYGYDIDCSGSTSILPPFTIEDETDRFGVFLMGIGGGLIGLNINFKKIL